MCHEGSLESVRENFPKPTEKKDTRVRNRGQKLVSNKIIRSKAVAYLIFSTITNNSYETKFIRNITLSEVKVESRTAFVRDTT